MLIWRLNLKQWISKLLEQLEWGTSDSSKTNGKPDSQLKISEEKATLLFILDSYSKHLFEIDTHQIRKVRETFDEISKSLVQAEGEKLEKLLFRLRQYFASYRLDESTYIQRTFDDFKGIIWDFADQLGEDLAEEKKKENEVLGTLNQLREAVEANSIEALRSKSREFIDFYVEYQTKKDERRSKRLSTVQKKMRQVKKKLMEASSNLNLDHLTGAFNRKSFDEHLVGFTKFSSDKESHVSLIALDIDHFKKVNDTYGHDVGDFIIKECVRILKEVFHRDQDFVARIGGEEFAVILPDHQLEHAEKKASECLQRIRREVFVHGDHTLKFTVSMGIAEWVHGESSATWLKRADLALYQSKQTGRDRYSVAPGKLKQVA